MVWVHTCVFPFYSELCGVRCGTHSTIRGVHTLFTPIDVQHAATEGHLERRERETEGEKGRGMISQGAKHLHFTRVPQLNKGHNTNSLFLAAVRLCLAWWEERLEPCREGCQPSGLWLLASQQGVVASTCRPQQDRADLAQIVCSSCITMSKNNLTRTQPRSNQVRKTLYPSNPDIQLRLEALWDLVWLDMPWSANATIFKTPPLESAPNTEMSSVLKIASH